jgi:hypothetical protein
MHQIKQAVPGERRSHDPQVALEPEDDRDQEHARGRQFGVQGVRRAAHHREQVVVGRDDDQNGGVEGAIPVQSDHAREHGDASARRDSDQIWH